MKAFFAILILSMGCSVYNHPCMTGFDLGSTVGRTKPISRHGSNTYADLSVTLHFDTTGACRVSMQSQYEE